MKRRKTKITKIAKREKRQNRVMEQSFMKVTKLHTAAKSKKNTVEIKSIYKCKYTVHIYTHIHM